MSAFPYNNKRCYEVRSLSATDGYPLNYYVWGPETAGDVVFFMPGDMAHSLWSHDFLSFLSRRGHKVVAIDRRGTGINEKDRGDAPSAAQLLDDTDMIFAEECGSRVCHLVGWSFGAIVLMNYLSFSPRDISSMVLITPYLFLRNRFIVRSVRNGAHPAPGSRQKEIPMALQEEDFTRTDYLQNFILADTARVRSVSPRCYEVQRRMIKYAWYMLRSLKIPTRLKVILGTLDRVVDNRKTEAAFSFLPDCEVQLITAEHGIQFEKPDELALGVASWIGTTRNM